MIAYLKESHLGQPLLAFAFAFYIMAVLWGEFRKKHPKIIHLLTTLDGEDKRQIEKGKFCKLLVMCFTTIVLCFSFYPYIYKTFIPISQLDNPYINLLGLVTLATSLIWLVIAQVDFDKELYNIHGVANGVKYIDISLHSKRIVAGYFLMFIGVTITLANIVSTVLLITAFVVYRRK
jgi:hypothetical protein